MITYLLAGLGLLILSRQSTARAGDASPPTPEPRYSPESPAAPAQPAPDKPDVGDVVQTGLEIGSSIWDWYQARQSQDSTGARPTGS